jgi:hypothetical protein
MKATKQTGAAYVTHKNCQACAPKTAAIIYEEPSAICQKYLSNLYGMAEDLTQAIALFAPNLSCFFALNAA